MASPEFHVEQDGTTLKAHGALTFDTAAAALAATGSMLQAQTHQELDLGNLARVDSAGLACLLGLLAMARSRRATLRVTHAPGDLLALARVCDVEDFLTA